MFQILTIFIHFMHQVAIVMDNGEAILYISIHTYYILHY